MAVGLEEDSANASDVLHGLVEKHEVHGRHSLVVFSEFTLKGLFKVLHLLNRLVRGLVTLAHRDEGGVDERLSEDDLFLVVSEFLQTVPHEVHVGVDVLFEEESIEPDSVALVSPHADESRGVALVGGGLSEHQILHNLRNISHVELVVELAGSGGELRREGNASEDIDGGRDEFGDDVDAGRVEWLEVLHHHLLVDREQDVLLRSAEHDLSEVTRRSQVDVEGTTLGVHASSEHDVLQDELVLEVVTVEDDLEVDDLADQTERGLSAEVVDSGHVQIVHEEDQMATGSRTQNLTRALVDVALKHSLERLRVGVRVKVHGGVDALLQVKGGEVILDDSSLTGTSSTDVEHGSVN
mmetsp:Transcript_43975/g.58339  ORF Transcript_43975/g.58339 Transcript_43975/m.58339 type:complete len:354 (+) Transcript_43975:2013-3074(+)